MSCGMPTVGLISDKGRRPLLP